MAKTYSVVLSVDDRSSSDGEDIEEYIQMLLDGELPEGLPSDLDVHIVEIIEDECN